MASKVLFTLALSLLLTACSKGGGGGAGGGGGGESSGESSSSSGPAFVGPPVVTGPPGGAISTNGSSLSIFGACLNGYTVSLSGDSIQSTACATNTFSFNVSKSVDGTYNFSLKQSNGTLESESSLVTWVRDTVIPSPPVITAPAANPYISTTTNATVAGTCEVAATVSLFPLSLTTICDSSGTFSFNFNNNIEGTQNYSLVQTDWAGNVSGSTPFTWIRDSLIPPAPTIANPSTNPHSSGGNSVTITGGCEPAAAVNVAGDGTANATCSGGGTYSVIVSKSVDGIYNFQLSQTDLAGNTSPTTPFQWIRTSDVPPAPTISSPSASPHYSNLSMLTISGGCETGNEVDLAGASVQSQTCAGSTFSFNIPMSSDGAHNFSLTQTRPSLVTSSATSFQWVRDTVAPAAPTITAPASNPFISADTNLIISGSCENGASVSLSGDSSDSVACSSSAYSFLVSKSSDDTYGFSVTQTDLAGNTSSAATLDWQRDTTIPATPSINTPSSNPFHSNSSTLAVDGTCENGNTVELVGDDSQSTTCAGSSYSFSINKSSDGAYNFSISQRDVAGNSSAQANLMWIRDTVAPSAPTITTPTANPYMSSGNLTLAGGCETNSTVALSGDDTQAATCVSSAYTFTINQSVDATYNFSIVQTDRAGNASSAIDFEWIRDSSTPPTPTITTPSSNPYLSNGSVLTVSGGCENTSTISITGDATEDTPCMSSTYTFNIPKSSDATYNFSIFETRTDGSTSASASLQWTRDTVAPTVNLTAMPPAINLAALAQFTFTASEPGSTFLCRIDGGTYANCTSPTDYTGLSNVSHTFEIYAVDAAGNAGSVTSHTWTQQFYNTLALYHFDTSPGSTVDSSLFSGALHNDLTNSGTTTGSSAVFGQSRGFASASSQYMSAPSSSSLALANKIMTVDARVRFASLPATGQYMAIATKSGSAGNYGWQIALKRQSGSYRIAMIGSLNGTTTVERRSSAITVNTSTFYHIAVTWQQGTVKFYFNGAAVGTQTIGTAGSAEFFNSTAALQIGRSATGSYLNGIIDELRISQNVRWTSTFTVPSSAYTAD